LETLASGVGQPVSGFLATNRYRRWSCTASTGGGPEANLGERIDGFLGGARLRTTSRALCAVHRGDGPATALRLELAAPSPAEFSEDDAVILKVALDLVGAYATFSESRHKERAAQETMKQILDLVSGLSETESDDDSFFQELLHSALAVVTEADSGSVALLDGGSWRFVGVVGHDPGLRRLRIPEAEFGSFSEVTVIDRLLSRTDLLSPQSKDLIGALSKPIAVSLLVGLDVGPNSRLNLSLDIEEGSRNHFSPGSRLAVERFIKLAGAFLRLQLQKEFVERSYRNFTDKLALLAEAHDKDTALHNVRVSLLSGFLAEKMGLGPLDVKRIRQGAMLHDIGKVFLPPDLLNKSGPLLEAERELLKQHTLLAERLLDDPYFELDQKIAVYHHERYDGKGYPRGLKGDQIPIAAQIVSAADVYDALRSVRSYKTALGPREALARMKLGDERLEAGGFNPEILTILEDNWVAVEFLCNREP